jgi:hypothetical protein
MKEQDLIDLGFERFDHEDEGYSFYYYSYDIKNKPGGGNLLSDANDEVNSEDGWEVYAWDINEDLVFKNKEDIKIYIDVLEKNIK